MWSNLQFWDLFENEKEKLFAFETYVLEWAFYTVCKGKVFSDNDGRSLYRES